MKHLFKVYDNQTGDFMFNGEWLTGEEANDLIVEHEKEESTTLWAYIVIERRTGNIVNGCGLHGIHDLLREDSGYSSDDYMIQANFTFND